MLNVLVILTSLVVAAICTEFVLHRMKLKLPRSRSVKEFLLRSFGIYDPDIDRSLVRTHLQWRFATTLVIVLFTLAVLKTILSVLGTG